MANFNLLDYDLIIFDLDGTMADTAPDIVEAVKYIITYFAAPPRSDEEVAGFIGGGARKVLLKSLGSTKEQHIEEALILFKKYYNEHCADKTRLYPGVTELLEYLKHNNKTLAVCTLKIKDATLKILEKNKIIDYFASIVTADDISQPKPDPQGINLVLSQLKMNPQQAIIIGDTTQDILAAHNAHIDSIGVSYGYEAPEIVKSAKPLLMIDELTALINNGNK